VWAINEKYRLRNIVFLLNLSERCLSDNRISGWFKACIQQFIYPWIDCRVRPILFIIEPDHRLINCNVIRIFRIRAVNQPYESSYQRWIERVRHRISQELKQCSKVRGQKDAAEY